MTGRLPNLIIAGVVKGGTTSLYTYLSQHPDFCASDVKETSFFKRFFYDTDPAEPPQGAPDLDLYRRHFARCRDERIVFEASPGYINGGAALAQWLRGAMPGLKVAIILRDPADRCRSAFEYEKGMLRLEDALSLSDYLAACRAREAEGVLWMREHRAYRGIRDGRYADWLGGWMEAFGDDLAILFFDDLKADPAAFTDRVCAWLGTTPATTSGVDFAAVNVSAQPRNRAVQGVALALNKALERTFRRNPGLKRRLRAAYLYFNPPKPISKPAEAEMVALRAEFADANARLRALFATHRPDLPLPAWLRNA